MCFDVSFGKYMVFETQLFEIWESAFNVESNISFMHSKSRFQSDPTNWTGMTLNRGRIARTDGPTDELDKPFDFLQISQFD